MVLDIKNKEQFVGGNVNVSSNFNDHNFQRVQTPETSGRHLVFRYHKLSRKHIQFLSVQESPVGDNLQSCLTMAYDLQ